MSGPAQQTPPSPPALPLPAAGPRRRPPFDGWGLLAVASSYCCCLASNQVDDDADDDRLGYARLLLPPVLCRIVKEGALCVKLNEDTQGMHIRIECLHGKTIARPTAGARIDVRAINQSVSQALADTYVSVWTMIGLDTPFNKSLNL